MEQCNRVAQKMTRGSQTVYVRGLCGGKLMRYSKFTDRADVFHLPSVKLHLSQPEEEGVLHGETPSSPPETMIKNMQILILRCSLFILKNLARCFNLKNIIIRQSCSASVPTVQFLF